MKLVIFHNFCPELEAFWKTLEPDSLHYGFQSYGFLNFWQKTIGRESLGLKPWIAIVLDGGENPKMIFPFGLRKSFGASVLEFLGGSQVDYQTPLIHRDWLANAQQVQAAWNLIHASLPKNDVQHFIKLPLKLCAAENPMLTAWKCKLQSYSYSTKLPNTFAEYQKKMRTKLKADNNRQRRRLSEKGTLSFETLDEKGHNYRAATDVMIMQKSLRYRSMGVPDIFTDKMVRRFYHELPTIFANEGRVHFSVLRLNDEILATHWGIVYRDRFYFLMPTFDNEKWGNYSPGRLLLENLLEWSIPNNLKIFDFTIGGEEYKKDWCDGEMPLYEHLNLMTPKGVPYFFYIRLRRYLRNNDKLWNLVKASYSFFRYGKRK